MSDPKRLKDDGGEVSEEIRALLATAPPTRSMTAEERSGLTRTALWILVMPVAWLTVGRIAVALAAVALGGAAVVVAVRPRAVTTVAPQVVTQPAPRRARVESRVPVMEPPVTEPPRRTVTVRRAPPSAPRATTVVVPERTVQPVEAAPPSTVSAIATAPSTPASPPPPTDQSLSAESAMLLQARGLLANDPAGALGVLDRHAAVFARPQLADERDFMAVEALRRLGRADEARARAAEVVRRSPQSPYARLLQRGAVQNP